MARPLLRTGSPLFALLRCHTARWTLAVCQSDAGPFVRARCHALRALELTVFTGHVTAACCWYDTCTDWRRPGAPVPL